MMDRNELLTIAQRLRECVNNPHHIDPMSEAFKTLISEASEALSIAAAPVPPAGVIFDEVAPITEQACRSLDSQPAGEVEVLPKRREQPDGFTAVGWANLRGWNEYHDAVAPMFTRLTAVLDDYKAGQERYEQLIEDLQSELTKARERMDVAVSLLRNGLNRGSAGWDICVNEFLHPGRQSAPAAKECQQPQAHPARCGCEQVKP